MCSANGCIELFTLASCLVYGKEIFYQILHEKLPSKNVDKQASVSNNENTMNTSTFPLPFSPCNVFLAGVCSLTSVYFSTSAVQQGVRDLTLASITSSHITKDPTPTLICNLSNCWHLKLNPQTTNTTGETVTDYCRLWSRILSTAVYTSSLYMSVYICIHQQ